MVDFVAFAVNKLFISIEWKWTGGRALEAGGGRGRQGAEEDEEDVTLWLKAGKWEYCALKRQLQNAATDCPAKS